MKSFILLTILLTGVIIGFTLFNPSQAKGSGSEINYLPIVVAPCWPTGIPVGAIPGQPQPVFCNITNSGPDTSSQTTNTWLDEFNHGLSFASFANTEYQVYESIGVYQSLHWRHANHWMIDLAPHGRGDPLGQAGGAMIRPDRSFHFEDGTLIIEADLAAGISAYEGDAWGELVISTGSHPQGYAADGIYGYDMFPEYWTLGCRLQPDRHPICALKDNSGDLATNTPSQRLWEMSFFQDVGTYVYGGEPSGERGEYWRVCENTDPDTNCRDRFRLELTRTSLKLYVNGLLYFEQSGIPPLPNALMQGDIYIYFASIEAHHSAEAIRYHWDRLAVNPSTPPSPAPGFPLPTGQNLGYESAKQLICQLES